jgi:HSP20 family protein
MKGNSTMAENTVPTTTSTGNEPVATREDSRYIVPALDIHETDDALIVTADLPGVERKDINIRVEVDVLTISTETEQSFAGDEVLQEWNLLRYYRQFRLNERIDQSLIQAELKNGVLTVRLPKSEAAKPKQIEIKVV